MDEFFKAFPDGPLQWFWTNDGEARVVDTATNRVVAEMRTQSPYSDQAKAVAIGLAHTSNLVNILTLIVEAHGKNDNNKLDVLIGVAQNGLNIMHDEFNDLDNVPSFEMWYQDKEGE